MAAAIVYGAVTGIIRRIVWTDEPGTLSGHAGEGEAVLIAPENVFVTIDGGTLPDVDVAVKYLFEATGITPEPSRCVVVHHGTAAVVGVVIADPVIDRIEGHTIFQDEFGGIGSVPDETGTFRAPRAS